MKYWEDLSIIYMFYPLVKSIKWSYKELGSNDYDGLKMINTSKSGFFERGGGMLKGNLPESFVDSSFSFLLILTWFEITLKKELWMLQSQQDSLALYPINIEEDIVSFLSKKKSFSKLFSVLHESERKNAQFLERFVISQMFKI